MRKLRDAPAAFTALIVAALVPITTRSAPHPFATDDPGTTPAAAVELELSSEASRPSDRASDLRLGMGLSTHVGVIDGADLGATLVFCSTRSEPNGWAFMLVDPVFDVKGRFLMGEGLRPAMALRLDYRPPLFSDDGQLGHDLGVAVMASWAHDPLGVHFSLNTAALALGHDANDQLGASLALLVEATANLHVGLEGLMNGSIGQGVTDGGTRLGVVWEIAWPTAVSLGTSLGAGAGGRLSIVGTLGLTVLLGAS